MWQRRAGAGHKRPQRWESRHHARQAKASCGERRCRQAARTQRPHRSAEGACASTSNTAHACKVSTTVLTTTPVPWKAWWEDGAGVTTLMQKIFVRWRERQENELAPAVTCYPATDTRAARIIDSTQRVTTKKTPSFPTRFVLPHKLHL